MPDRPAKITDDKLLLIRSYCAEHILLWYIRRLNEASPALVTASFTPAHPSLCLDAPQENHGALTKETRSTRNDLVLQKLHNKLSTRAPYAWSRRGWPSGCTRSSRQADPRHDDTLAPALGMHGAAFDRVLSRRLEKNCGLYVEFASSQHETLCTGHETGGKRARGAEGCMPEKQKQRGRRSEQSTLKPPPPLESASPSRGTSCPPQA